MEKIDKVIKWLTIILIIDVLAFIVWICLEIKYGHGTTQLPDNVHTSYELINTGNSIND